MATDFNRVILIGRLTRDVDLRQIPSGTSIASFSIANNRSYVTGNGEKREEVSFFNCILWGKQGEAFAKYVKKGHRVAIEGRLQQRTWQDKDGNNRSTTEVVADAFQFLEARQDGGRQDTGGYNSASISPQQNSPAPYDGPSPDYGRADNVPDTFNDDDIPF